MDICLVRDERRLALVPGTDLDRDRLARLPKGFPMEAQVRFARTSKLNRWYRGLVAHVAEAIGVHPDALHADLKTKAGLIEQVMLSGQIRGAVVLRLRSTAFPEMDDTEFDAYVSFAVETMFSDYLPHVRAGEKRGLIGEWAGRRPKLEGPPKLLKL
jgi:hypothetical protein